MRLQE
jgi:uncharacterized protein YhaN